MQLWKLLFTNTCKYACNTNNNTHKIWENMMLTDWSLRWWILLKISRFTSASAAASKKFSPYTWQGSCWRYWWWSLHYWLRRPLGVWRVQKVVQSRYLFFTIFFALCETVMTHILQPKKFIPFSESKYCQNHGQCSEKLEGGLIRGWVLLWWK